MGKITVAISGPPGSGTSTIAKELAKRLKLEYFSPGQIQKSYSKSSKESLAALDVWQTKLGKSRTFHRDILDKTQKELAKKGNIVICGKLSIKMLEGLADYRIWVYAPINIRAERVAERDKITVDEAMNALSEREEIERKAWKRLYGFDYFDQKELADLVVDNSKTLEESVERILKFIKSKP